MNFENYIDAKGYYIFAGNAYMSFEEINALLKQSYWANERSKELVLRSIKNSRCYGVKAPNQELIGFGRVITDYATTYYVCDIIIDMDHRRMGLGKELMQFITQDAVLKDLSGMLVTENAHRFYEKFGFVRSGNRFMLKIKE